MIAAKDVNGLRYTVEFDSSTDKPYQVYVDKIEEGSLLWVGGYKSLKEVDRFFQSLPTED